MIVTINTDASFSHEYQKGAFAFWIICNQGKFCHSGMLRKKCINSHVAEMKCIINAVHQLGTIGFTFITKIIINTDSMNSIALINNDKKSIKKYGLHKWGKQLQDDFKNTVKRFNLIGIPIEPRHVKAHQNTEDRRTFVNNWCDSEAKKHLREYVDKIKKARN